MPKFRQRPSVWAGGPSYREAKGGAVDLFHHKRDVRAITDLLPNRCEDTSTVHHRELRQSPETNAFPDANFSCAL
jgi:hypothetical protein